MRFPHLFEFMDLGWLPPSLRTTLREILDGGNSRPFRSYYDWVADSVLTVASEIGSQTIVELGAGTAPVTRHMAGDSRSDSCRLVICDVNPDHTEYARLVKCFPGNVHVIDESVDFTVPRRWPDGTLLVLSATLHHIPSDDRMRVIASLTESAETVMVFEPLRKTLLSLIFVFLSIVPAIVLPLWYIRRTGTFSRAFWCWLVPVAPVMFWWDGIVSCLRQWSNAEWRHAFSDHDFGRSLQQLESSVFCQKVTW
jgi:hypothetical protein